MRFIRMGLLDHLKEISCSYHGKQLIYFSNIVESALKTPFFQITEKRSFAGKM